MSIYFKIAWVKTKLRFSFLYLKCLYAFRFWRYTMLYRSVIAYIYVLSFVYFVIGEKNR